MNYSSIYDSLYLYQKEAVRAAQDNDKGCIILPTGTGKTRCEAAIIAADIIAREGQFGIYVINAPRIVLTFQLLKEFYKLLTKVGIPARYMFVHSGGKAEEAELEDIRIQAELDGNTIPFAEMSSGTTISSIMEMAEKAQRQNLPLILISTYHSAERIAPVLRAMGENISIMINDEAHYLVQEQFHKILDILIPRRNYFFTATARDTPSDKGLGMGNTERYGEHLYVLKPRRAIDLGRMVRPRMHFVEAEGIHKPEEYEKSKSFVIQEGFRHHAVVLSGKLQPKVLVSVEGTQDIKRFLYSEEYKKLVEEGVHIFTIACHDEIGMRVNGEVIRKREEFLKRLKFAGEQKETKILILHYDTLAEGIDISGITGVMPLRSLKKSKFLQTYGRASRIDPEDRDTLENIRLENEELPPYNLDSLNKSYAYVIIPNITHMNEDDKENIKQLIDEFRDEHGFNPSEDIISSSTANGIPEIEELKSLSQVKDKLPAVGGIIEDLYAEIESKRVASLTPFEWFMENAERPDGGTAEGLDSEENAAYSTYLREYGLDLNTDIIYSK